MLRRFEENSHSAEHAALKFRWWSSSSSSFSCRLEVISTGCTFVGSPRLREWIKSLKIRRVCQSKLFIDRKYYSLKMWLSGMKILFICLARILLRIQSLHVDETVKSGTWNYAFYFCIMHLLSLLGLDANVLLELNDMNWNDTNSAPHLILFIETDTQRSGGAASTLRSIVPVLGELGVLGAIVQIPRNLEIKSKFPEIRGFPW